MNNVPSELCDQIHINLRNLIQLSVKELMYFLNEHYDILKLQPKKLHIEEKECRFKIDDFEWITFNIIQI